MGIGRAGIGGLGIGGLGIGGIGVGNISIPANALAFYNYALSPSVLAIREQVEKEGNLLVLNATNTADLVAGGVQISSTDNSTITTYLDKAELVDEQSNNTVQCKLGTLTAGDFIGGLRLIGEGALNNFATFRTSTEPSPVAGKYVTLLTTDWVGMIFKSRANNARIRVSGSINDGGGEFEILDGATDAEVRAGFAYPAEFDVDASRSLYAPSDVADWLAVRLAAGDTGLSDNTVQWITTNLSLTIPFKFNSGGTDGRIAVCGTGFDLHYDDANGRYELITALGTVVSGAISPSSGNEITFEVQVDSSSGGTLIVNGSAGTTNASVTAVTWTSSIVRYMNNLAGTAATDAIVHETLFKPL